MGGEVEQVYQGRRNMKKNGGNTDPRHVQWVIIEAENDNICDSEDSFESSEREDSSTISEVSSSSSDLVEDASSRTPSFGPLYELSELMNQLPIKRGLSKFYQGKSQSFTSLGNAGSIEDLAKKISPYSIHRMKSCKSYAGFDVRKFGPKATTITKKKGPFVSSLGRCRGSYEKHYQTTTS